MSIEIDFTILFSINPKIEYIWYLLYANRCASNLKKSDKNRSYNSDTEPLTANQYSRFIQTL